MKNRCLHKTSASTFPPTQRTRPEFPPDVKKQVGIAFGDVKIRPYNIPGSTDFFFGPANRPIYAIQTTATTKTRKTTRKSTRKRSRNTHLRSRPMRPMSMRAGPRHQLGSESIFVAALVLHPPLREKKQKKANFRCRCGSISIRERFSSGKEAPKQRRKRTSNDSPRAHGPEGDIVGTRVSFVL